jgi:signal transduction histidine kinase
MNKGGKLTIKSVEKEGFIEVSFSDTGVGIKKEDLSKIFDPLFSTKVKGTGLGLSVCLSLVEGHSGKIAVESEYGQGATFTVKLPIIGRT